MLGENTTADTHRLQLLDEQLVGIRDFNGAEIGGIPAPTTHPNTIRGIRHRKNAAIAATEATEGI